MNVGGCDEVAAAHVLVQWGLLFCLCQEKGPPRSHYSIVGPQSEPTWGSLNPSHREKPYPVGSAEAD